MDFDQILEVIQGLVIIVGIAFVFFFYFKNPVFKQTVNQALKFLPSLLPFLQRFTTDKEGVFDKYDALAVISRVSSRIKIAIEDPQNKKFEDVEDEVFEIVRDELVVYKDMPGVPDLDDPAIRAQVRVVFESIKRAMSEDSA